MRILNRKKESEVHYCTNELTSEPADIDSKRKDDAVSINSGSESDGVYQDEENSYEEDGISDEEDDADNSIDEKEEEKKQEDDDNDDDDNDNGGNEKSDDDEKQAAANKIALTQRLAPNSLCSEPCTLDLRNLLAMNTHPVDSVALYSMSKKFLDVKSTIPGQVAVNENYLLQKARDGCAQLLEGLWQLPFERSDAGPLVTLPTYEEIRMPRSLPPPPPKQETKWEKFAKDRGIATNKNKRTQKVWDEATGTWMFRHGYQKANNDCKEWPIMEVKDGDDPLADPWQKQRETKRQKIERNLENQLRNQERSGTVPKGTANNVIKSRAENRQSGKKGNDPELQPPSGVPIDITRSKGNNDATQSSHRGRKSTTEALLATQRSTASLGKFDKMREGEPERRKALAGLKKRKYECATDKKVNATETERGMKVLQAVIKGGGASKERDIKKGKFAKGETAYDYDYDDGLGAASFRKKKGRSGAGKMKKMTKKRVK